MKNSALLAIALCISVCSLAQKHLPKFGLKAGANFSDLSENVAGLSSSKTGLYAGALWHIHLGREWALQPEAVYSRQGLKDGIDKLHLDYINIPVQLQYMFDNGFRLETGPQLGVLINTTSKSGDTENDIYKSDVFNNIDLSWGIGLNYLSSSGLGVGGRYNYGLTDVYEPTSQKEANRVWQVGLFYMIDHQHKAKSK